jgi:ribosomal protein S12 methylthiotransferase accessory factor
MPGGREPDVSGTGNAAPPDDLRASLAAAAEAHERGAVPRDASAARLLDTLGYTPGADGSGAGSTGAGSTGAGNRSALLRLAARMARTFRIASPSAPGLACFGAQLRGEGWVLNASGAGLTLAAAFQACMGEAAEFLSQLERPGDITCTSPLAGVAGRTVAGECEELAARLRAAGLAEDAPLDWVAGQDLSNGAAVLLPADLVLRRAPGRALLPVDGRPSLGCGAGPTIEAARRHGLLEVLERDAAALWWRGGMRGQALPLEPAVLGGPMHQLAALRGGVTERATWLLDITADTRTPCVAALSCDADGFGLACGIAARSALPAAAEAALRELCQMELSGSIIASRLRARGPQGLTEADHDALARLTQVDTRDATLLHPLPQPRPLVHAPSPDFLPYALAQQGYGVGAATLTRADIGIPVAVIRVPGLEREPGEAAFARLRRAIAATGGSAFNSSRIRLM